MRFARVGRRSVLPFCSLLLLSATAACTTWQAGSAAPAQLLAAPGAPDRVIVRDRQGARFELVNPKVQGDTLSGGDEAASAPGQPYVLRRVALADIDSIYVRHRSAFRTAAVAAVPALGFFLGSYLVGY